MTPRAGKLSGQLLCGEIEPLQFSRELGAFLQEAVNLDTSVMGLAKRYSEFMLQKLGSPGHAGEILVEADKFLRFILASIERQIGRAGFSLPPAGPSRSARSRATRGRRTARSRRS